MTSLEQVRELDHMGVEFAGFIFYPKSPRYVKKFHLSSIDLRNEKLKINKVGVFVNETKEEILRIVDQWRLEMVQLHGDESPYFCQQLSGYVTVIKALRIGEKALMQWDLEQYKDACDLFLFDTLHEQYGGTGKQFNWEQLEHCRIPNPYFLSGGIGLEDADKVKEFLQKPVAQKMFAIDVNSRFEVRPGVKEMNKVKAFIDKLK